MKKSIIRFANGKTIEAEQNATSLITDFQPTFPDDLSVVTVQESDGAVRTYKNAKIVKCASIDGRYWFGIREVPESERIQKQMQANIEYIAMMADVDLEEE